MDDEFYWRLEWSNLGDPSDSFSTLEPHECIYKLVVMKVVNSETGVSEFFVRRSDSINAKEVGDDLINLGHRMRTAIMGDYH